MKLLNISTDRLLFVEGSDVQKRIKEYGKLFEELHIIVFSKIDNDFKKISLGDNIFIYPTNSKYKIYYIFDAYKIAKKLANKIDIVSCQDPFETSLVGWLMKIKHKKPFQIQVHTDVYSTYFWQESIKNRIRVLMANLFFKKAVSIRVVSKRIKDSLIRRFKFDDSFIINLPIFVDVKKIQSKKIKTDLHKKYPEYDKIILMASRLTKEKNIQLAIEAMKDVIKNNPQTLLLIVGDGPEVGSLNNLINKYFLNNNIIIEPWNNDLASYYKTADIFLLTSNYEGYGRTIIEAMSVGLPVISTNVGLVGEFMKNNLNGVVVPINNKHILADTISSLIVNFAKREELTLRSIDATSNLISKKEYLNLYKDSFNNLFNIKPKLVYILPRYDENDSTHFAYIHKFLKEISKIFDIFLIIEKGTYPKLLRDCKKIKVINSKYSLFRIVWLRWWIFYARLLGYKDYYVHYSFIAAFLSSFFIKIFGGRVFYWNCGEPWKYKRGLIRNLFERITYKMVTHLVTGTSSMAKEYSNHYNIPLSKIKVMPNWIDLENVKEQKNIFNKKYLKEKLNIRGNQKVLLFVHRLSKRKGAHYLSYIADKLKEKNTIMIVIGDGSDAKQLKLKIKNIGLESHTRFLGWIPNNELASYYNLADIFIMPSDEEGFPHVILEAMAYNVPFVATNVGGVKDIIPKEINNYLVDAGDIDLFIKKIEELLNLKVKDLSLIKKALGKHAENYDLPMVIEIFKKMLW